MNGPLPPIIEASPSQGGGNPNARAVVGTGPSQSPALEIGPELLVTESIPVRSAPDGMVAMLEGLESRLEGMVDLEVDGEPLEMLWSGAPSKSALRQLRLESYCPGFVVSQAREVLVRLWEGESLKRICGDAGMPSRSVVMWWSELVPEFGAMLERAQTGLGAVMRDEAMEVVLDPLSDPARSRAALAVAAAYDRRITKGDGDGVQVATGITVTVQKFGSSGGE